MQETYANDMDFENFRDSPVMNMIMEKNFTCLYCSHETYLDRVYMQQSKSKKHIYYVWHDTSINQIKCNCQEHNHFVNEGLLEGMRDYKRE